MHLALDLSNLMHSFSQLFVPYTAHLYYHLHTNNMCVLVRSVNIGEFKLYTQCEEDPFLPPDRQAQCLALLGCVLHRTLVYKIFKPGTELLETLCSCVVINHGTVLTLLLIEPALTHTHRSLVVHLSESHASELVKIKSPPAEPYSPSARVLRGPCSWFPLALAPSNAGPHRKRRLRRSDVA